MTECFLKVRRLLLEDILDWQITSPEVGAAKAAQFGSRYSMGKE